MLAPTSYGLLRSSIPSVASSSRVASGSLGGPVARPLLVRSLADEPVTHRTPAARRHSPDQPTFSPWKKDAFKPTDGTDPASKSKPKGRPKTHAIPLTQLNLNYTFSTIPPAELTSRLAVKKDLYTPKQLAALSTEQQSIHTTIINILAKSLRMDDDRRIKYFAEIDRPKEDVALGRREKAREDINEGKHAEEDSLELEEYEKLVAEQEETRTKEIEAKEVDGKTKALQLKALRKGFEIRRKKALLRREILAEGDIKTANGVVGESPPSNPTA